MVVKIIIKYEKMYESQIKYWDGILKSHVKNMMEKNDFDMYGSGYDLISKERDFAFDKITGGK